MTIGVYDSGVGGLAVLREIHRLLPDTPTLYYADQAHLPLGEKSPDQIFQYVNEAAQFMAARGARLIVLACHTASADSLHPLRAAHPHLPFVGIEPAVKPAAEGTKTGSIGVLCTRATAHGALYRRVVERFAAQTQVVTRIAPELVELVEANAVNTTEGRAALGTHVDAFTAANADHIVLACTHFTFLASALAALTPATLIDPGPAVARQTARVLATLPSSTGEARQNVYFTSGDPALFQRMLKQFIGVDAPVQRGL